MHQALLENNFLQFTVYAFVSLGSIAIRWYDPKEPSQKLPQCTYGYQPLGMEEGFVKLL